MSKVPEVYHAGLFLNSAPTMKAAWMYSKALIIPLAVLVTSCGEMKSPVSIMEALELSARASIYTRQVNEESDKITILYAPSEADYQAVWNRRDLVHDHLDHILREALSACEGHMGMALQKPIDVSTEYNSKVQTFTIQDCIRAGDSIPQPKPQKIRDGL